MSDRPDFVDGEDPYRQPVQLHVDDLDWRPGVYALLMLDEDQMLVLDNIESGALEIPGGGMETWETVPQTLVREVWEETGLSVKFQAVIGVENHFFMTKSGRSLHTLSIVCTAEVLGGELRNTVVEDEPSQNPRWMHVEDVDLSRFVIGADTLRRYLQ